MTPRRRWLALIVVLIAVLALVLFDRQALQGVPIVDAVAPRAAKRASTEAASSRGAEEAMILPIRPRTPADNIGDAFATLDWRPPPPAPPKPVAPTPVLAPPLPYSVIGKKLEEGVWQVFLRNDERVLVVKTSDTIDNAYRVDEIRPPVMTLTHLPTQQRQTFPIGSGE